MFRDVSREVKPALVIIIFFTIFTGLIYPSLMTMIAQLVFPWKANGSIIEKNGKPIGSLLIGQSFTEDNYFYGRPSATSPFSYNGESSSGSNMGPLNPDFLQTIKERVNQLQKISLTNNLVPVDLVTTSGSGLDPDISPLAAYYQVPRVAKFRNLKEEEVKNLINKLIQRRQFGIFGEPRINVLQLNIALDKLESKNVRKSP